MVSLYHIIMMMNYEKSAYLPAKVKSAMCQNPELGVCVVYKDNRHNIWHAMQHSATKFAKLRVASMVFGGQVSDFEHNFVIVDKNGEICSTNYDAKISGDKLGVIHVENDKCLIRPLQDPMTPRYDSPKNMHELKSKIKCLVRAGQVKPPKGFGKYGYPTESANAGPSFE
jgi:hypothetical protein